MKLMTGNSNLPLARDIASYLELPLTDALVRRFADEEIFVEIRENVRGEDVFVLQSTGYPANDNLMELLICIDALKRASAKRITAVIPYFGYARQDRKPGPRTPISAKLVANLITVAGADRVLSVDLHAGQIQGFFDIPTDNLFAAPVMSADILTRYGKRNLMVVSPDVGGVVRARALAKRLDNAPLAIVDKRRERAGALVLLEQRQEEALQQASQRHETALAAALAAQEHDHAAIIMEGDIGLSLRVTFGPIFVQRHNATRGIVAETMPPQDTCYSGGQYGEHCCGSFHMLTALVLCKWS